MKAWDIFSWRAPGWPEPHPAVIVSHPDCVANKPDVTVILCSSRRATRQPEPNEMIFDANDVWDIRVGLHRRSSARATGTTFGRILPPKMRRRRAE